MDDDMIFREIYLDEQCREAMCEADSKAVLDEVIAILMQDYKTLSKNNMDHKASGVHRAINLIKQYRRKNFI